MATADHYLQRKQIAPIFLSFVLIALPLSWLQISSVAPPVRRAFMVSYLLLVGNTHFAITWFLYLNRTNLLHFGSSRARRVIYFLVPPLIMAAFCAIGVLGVPAEGTSLAVWFAIGLSSVDYFHVVRQSFGVLQLFKMRAQAEFPRRQSRIDNAYFLSLWVLQLTTFLNGVGHGFDGRFDASGPTTQLLVLANSVLFALTLRSFAAAWRRAKDRGALLTALVYLLLQSASALLVVYRSRLYLPSLAMHYVEYHVLMYPRCFRSPLDVSSRVDRLAAALRSRKLVFYGIVVAIATCVSAGDLFDLAGASVTKDDARFGWLFVNLLNGIFVAHYFVEAFVWKLRNPFYRETLAPLYFGARPEASAREGAAETVVPALG